MKRHKRALKVEAAVGEGRGLEPCPEHTTPPKSDRSHIAECDRWLGMWHSSFRALVRSERATRVGRDNQDEAKSSRSAVSGGPGCRL